MNKNPKTIDKNNNKKPQNREVLKIVQKLDKNYKVTKRVPCEDKSQNFIKELKTIKK